MKNDWICILPDCLSFLLNTSKTELLRFVLKCMESFWSWLKWKYFGLDRRINLSQLKPVPVAEWVARQTAEQEVGSSNPGIPPLLKHACGEGDWLPFWHYTLAKVLHQRWISGNVYQSTPLQSSNKVEPTLALKPRGDITRSPKQGYQWPHKWTCVQQKF